VHVLTILETSKCKTGTRLEATGNSSRRAVLVKNAAGSSAFKAESEKICRFVSG
jgi:hypothetical protein